MKKIVCNLILTIICLTFLDVQAAETCKASELQKLKELANNVQFKTNYEVEPYSETIDDEEYKSVSLIYSIDIVNFDNNLKIKVEDADIEELLYPGTTKVEGLAEGDTVKFTIYSYSADECTNKILKTQTIELPVYNDYYYYNKEKCEENPDFKYCQEFLDTSDISDETIEESYEEYTNPKKEETKSEGKSHINYYLIAGIGAGILIIIVTIVIIKKYKKHKKTEDL